MSNKKDIPDNSESMLLLAGVGAAVLGYVMPAIVFKGTGNAVHDLSMIEKMPILSAVVFASLAAALVTHFVPNLRRWAEQATVLAMVLVVAPALWGFITAIDAWSGLRATIVQMAGTRNVFINPGYGYVAMLVGAGLLALSLRIRRQAPGDAAAA